MPHRLKDRVWRMSNLYWIIDKESQRVKFKPNWAQMFLLKNMWFFNLILKARQLGVTTFWCIFALDMSVFNSNIRCGIIAHNREDAQDIFADKIKYPFLNMFTDDEGNRLTDNPITAVQDSARKLQFSNNSSIRVGTSMRSGTIHFLHITELGKICAKFPEKAREIKTGALNTVHEGQMVVIESTAEGAEGDYHDMCIAAQKAKVQGKELSKLDYRFFFFPWWMHPEYVLDTNAVTIPSEHDEYFDELETKCHIKLTNLQKYWYVKKYETQQDDMKREYPSTAMEAFEQSVIGAYYQKQMIKLRKERRLTFVPHDPSKLTHTAWDLGINDEMTIWFFQIDGMAINCIDYYENTGEGLEHYIQEIIDRNHLPYGKHYAPHDINKRDLISGKNRIVRAQELGITFEMIERAADTIEDINEVRRIFHRVFIDEKHCAVGVKGMDNYRKEWNEKLGRFRDKPLHNWASNPADGFRTLTHAVHDLTPKPSDDYDDIFKKTGTGGANAWMG